MFLDKDGTLVEDMPHDSDPAGLRLLPGTASGLKRLHRAGYRLIVVSNQPGVALGRIPEPALESVRLGLAALFEKSGARLSGFYYCPHHPEGRGPHARFCGCRKPAPGLIERACREQRLDPKRSWLVGDILNDVEAGRRARCRTVLLDNGHETEWKLGRFRRPHLVASDLDHASRLILAEDR